MKAVIRIEITNFQSHASTVIEPAGAGKLTVLTGATDSGKSAVFRALRWLYFGGPLYVRTGCSAASVTVHLTDGTIVTRTRSSSMNRYVVTLPGEDPQVYEGFGRDIPLEVQHALGVRPLDIAGLSLEVNLARQHDPAFLVSGVSAPARAKALGQIAGVEAVDLAIKSAGRDLFEGQRSLKQVESEIEQLHLEASEYDYLPALAERIERAESVIQRLEALEDRRGQLQLNLNRLESLRVQRVQYEAILRKTAGAAEAIAAIDRVQSLAVRLTALTRIQRTLADCGKQETQARATLAWTAGAEAALTAVSRAQDLVSRQAALRRIDRTLADLQGREREARAAVVRTAGAAEALVIASRAREMTERLRRLTDVRTRITINDAERHRVEERKVKLTAALVVVDPSLKEAEAKLYRHSFLRQTATRLKSLRVVEDEWTRKKTAAIEAVETARKAYAGVLEQAGRCPVCGGPVNHEHLKEVV